MENRIVKFKSKESAGLNLHAIPGHFATSHSHINYYVDVTSIKTRVSEAKEAAKVLSQATDKLLSDYFGSEMVNSDHLSFSLFTLILPPWALITCST